MATSPRMSARERLRQWLKTLQKDPSAEARAMEERREKLLEELNRAVADAPEDLPIKTIIERLNRHYED